MKKILLSCGLMLLALGANAQGITAVGANVELLPSTYYGSSVEARCWSARTWVYNTGQDFGSDWSEENPNYNIVWGTPENDFNDNPWYAVNYDPDAVFSIWNDFTGDEIVWEEHNAPFSEASTYNGATTTYFWTSYSVMADIYLRRTFTVNSVLSGDVYLSCGHDDAPSEYYLNGTLIWSVEDGWEDAAFYKLTDEQKELIYRDGATENVLAVHVHQNWGGAFADCGLYTMVEGGLDMGYITAWDGQTIFNSCGGYNFNGNNTPNALHGWEDLYEAQQGDEYTFHIAAFERSIDDWTNQIHFKSAIDIDETHSYTFKATLTPSFDANYVTVKLCERDDDDVVLNTDAQIKFTANTAYNYEKTFTGTAVDNFKVVFDLAGISDASEQTFKVSNMSLYDNTAGKELWVGTHYFNYMYFENASSTHAADPTVDGRVETLAWTLPDFDDSMWDTHTMPIGHDQGNVVAYTDWPKGINNGSDGTDSYENTGFWIRRNFELESINPYLSYALNVCHDDCYQTYVNGHLLQENEGWTDGMNPVQVHIPAAYLNVGKNVIATNIQQNWGGSFYDCGINVEEVDYDECVAQLEAAIALGENTTADLTDAMRANLDALLQEARDYLANTTDAAEIKEYANTLTDDINAIIAYADNVTILRETISRCEEETDKGYLTEALANAKNNIESCEDSSDISELLDPLRIARKRNVAERREDTFVGSAPEANGRYYIFNVGEKQFLSGGGDWGTHTALNYASNAMALLPDTEGDDEGNFYEGYRIESFRPNGTLGENDFVGYNGYVDITPTNDYWEIIPVSGKTNVYNIARIYGDSNSNNADGKYYLGYRGGDNSNGVSYNIVDTDMNSPELESNQWMFITRDELDNLMYSATEDNPVDATHLISNPGFDQRLSIDDWLYNTDASGFGVWGRTANHADFAFEGWDSSSFEMFQEIYDDALIPGWYTVKCSGYYRDGTVENVVAKHLAGEKIERLAELVVNYEYTATLQSIIDGRNTVPGLGYTISGVTIPNSTTDAAEHYFECGRYRNGNNVTFKVDDYDAGYLIIAVEKFGGEEGDWVVLDNFRLVYLGTDEPTGIKAVEMVEEATPTSAAHEGIYNLNGQKLTAPTKGVNIINGTKVIVK